ncbi:hypothetical protein, partial [Mycobacterium sp.]|uniref:hypothetical protein n=1 Tax=Mycobacterium sp. TaxID=1785 RepID=UPI0028BEC700
MTAHRPYDPADGGAAVAHWMMFDSSRPPSRPDTTFPDTRQHGALHPPKNPAHSLEHHPHPHHRSPRWLARARRGGIQHHRHIQAALIREWSP